ncbi:MAG: hypothetical protein LBP59_11490 [Planctomycetaceae bacterium]|nr:hypothetical protein [Planctomycetaceae bacterium]
MMAVFTSTILLVAVGNLQPKRLRSFGLTIFCNKNCPSCPSGPTCPSKNCQYVFN